VLRRRDEQAGEELIRAGLRKEGIDVGFGHQAFGVVELALDGAQLARLPLTGHEVDATVRSSAPAAARTAIAGLWQRQTPPELTLETVFGHAVKKKILPAGENEVHFFPKKT